MDAFLGTILAWPIDYAPQDWAFCDGRTLPISQYAALYALLGTKYGGDGQNTFNLPDLRGRMVMGTNGVSPQPTQALGKTGGAAASNGTGTGSGSIVLTTANLPPHTHAATVTLAGLSGDTKISVSTGLTGGQNNATQGATLTSTTGGVPGAASIFLPSGTAQTAPVTLGGITTTVTGTGTVAVGMTGNGTAVPVSVNVATTTPTLPPYMALNFIICLVGIYPTRP